jgi:ABC transporter
VFTHCNNVMLWSWVQIYKTFKQNELLRGVSWECKRGDRVGLVGVNGAGKTTQLQILLGNVDADSGEVVKAKRNLQIAYLNQEFDIDPTRTVREELSSAFAEGMAVKERTEEIHKELEECTDDMDRMSALLDELSKLNDKEEDLDMSVIDRKLDKMMPELGFKPEDNERCDFAAGNLKHPEWRRPRPCYCVGYLTTRWHRIGNMHVVCHWHRLCTTKLLARYCHQRHPTVHLCAGKWPSIQAAGRCACASARFCCKNQMCCCSMSLPTILTLMPLSGWKTM